MSEEMCEFFEDSIKPLITELIGLREVNLKENELKIKLDATYKAVTDYVLHIKNCGFVKQFVILVNRTIKETDLLKRAINEQVFEHDLERLITSAHFAHYSLKRFCMHYSEDMKPFIPLLKRCESDLLSALKESAKLNPCLSLTINQVINAITSKNKPISICSGSIKPIIKTTVATASCALAFVDCGLTIAGLSALSAYHILENACPGQSTAFTQRDLNLIGLRAASKTLQKLIIALREKMIYEEDFGKHSRMCSKTVRVIEDELNKLNDLMLYKLKNDNEMCDLKQDSILANNPQMDDNYFTIIGE